MKFRDNGSLEIYDALFRDRIRGLPPHVVRMSVNIDVGGNGVPYAFITRALTNNDDLIYANGELVLRTERYRLMHDGDLVEAILEGEPRSEDDSNP